MGFFDKLTGNKKTDLRLMFLFWGTGQKNTCNLREVQVIDISPESGYLVDKNYTIPKPIRKVCYDSTLIEKFQHILNQVYENGGKIPKTMNVSQTGFLEVYVGMLQKIHKKYGKRINYVLCFVGEEDEK